MTSIHKDKVVEIIWGNESKILPDRWACGKNMHLNHQRKLAYNHYHIAGQTTDQKPHVGSPDMSPQRRLI